MLVLTDYSEEKYGKQIKAARNTYRADVEQFGDNGRITKNYGYINAVAQKHPDSWSYSYNDEVGALDHLLRARAKRHGGRRDRLAYHRWWIDAIWLQRRVQRRPA